MKATLDTVFTAVLVGCAVIVTALVVRGQLIEPENSFSTTPTSGTPVEISAWRELETVGTAFGPDDAPLVVTVFSDFECPFCRSFHETMQRVGARQPDRIRVVFLHYPLSYHRFAQPAALASECAKVQDRFEPMADALFAKQDSLGLLAWRDYARNAGVGSLPDFDKLMHDAAIKEPISAGRLAGTDLGVEGTPTILVNGWRLGAAPEEMELETMLARAERGEPAVRGRAN